MYELSPSASAVWLLLDGEATVADVTLDLAEILGRSPDEVTADIGTALADFRERGLLADDDGESAAGANDLAPSAPAGRPYPLPPPPGCGCGASAPTWPGNVVMRAGNAVFRVSYDNEITAGKIREAFAGRLDTGDPQSQPAVTYNVFGLRTARVGLLRRQLGLVYYGSALRHRAADLDAAIRTLSTIIAGIDQPVPDGLVALDVRLFTKGDRAALFEWLPAVDVDERRLAKSGIVSVPCWRVIVDPGDGSVLLDGRRLEIAAIIVGGILAGQNVDVQRVRLWGKATGDRSAWAWLLDRWGDQITATPDDPVATIAEALR